MKQKQKTAISLLEDKTLKKVYVNSPRSFEKVQENSRHEIVAIPIHQLQRVSRNTAWRKACLEAGVAASRLFYKTS
jgi:hypothetical protein